MNNDGTKGTNDNERYKRQLNQSHLNTSKGALAINMLEKYEFGILKQRLQKQSIKRLS